MIEAWVNTVVVGIFGLLTGWMLGLFAIASEHEKRRAAKPDYSSLKAFHESVLKSAEEGRGQWREMPTLGKAGLLAFYGLIAALFAVIRFSPLTMNWIAYLVMCFLGAYLARRLFDAARKGKLS